METAGHLSGRIMTEDGSPLGADVKLDLIRPRDLDALWEFEPASQRVDGDDPRSGLFFVAKRRSGDRVTVRVVEKKGASPVAGVEVMASWVCGEEESYKRFVRTHRGPATFLAIS
ncbi:MAG: hypothetical protein R3344_06410, partial [Acidobacteriota bacterium]|nr:hypothetical protein [Acidobacteriota bacterium]